MNDHKMSKEVEERIRKKILDIPYCDQSASQVLDIWYPNETSDHPYPVIVHFHGGGFKFGGHREDSVEPMLRGTDRGYAVVSVEYRKSGEAHFPAMLYDAMAAIRFLKANAGKYRLDPEKIALWGPSAGGWIVSMAALTAGNPAFENADMGNAEYDSSVQAVIDWCGPCGGFLDMDAAFRQTGKGEQEHDAPDSAESEFMGAPITEIPELVRLASPYVYVHKDMPPFMIVHGTADAIVPFEQSVTFADAIRKTAGEDKVNFYAAENAPHHGRVWWHEDWVSDMCFDYLDKVMLGRHHS
jgi:acetyl esterase/lipase